MKIYIRIVEDDGTENEHEAEFSKAQSTELALLLEISRDRARWNQMGESIGDALTIANLIPGLISIGTDRILDEYHRKALKWHLDTALSGMF